MKAQVIVSAAVVALAAASPTSAGAQEPIKIGFISTFSGPTGGLGQELFDGFRLPRQNERTVQGSRKAMAYIFKEDELPSLISVVPGRERTFFVNQELAHIDDMLAGVMRYKAGASSPYHFHANCEHFYFIIDGKATVESDEGVRAIGPGDLVFIPAEERHRLRATEPLFYFEWQAPNRFKTTILDGSPDDLRWERRDGRVWVQT